MILQNVTNLIINTDERRRDDHDVEILSHVLPLWRQVFWSVLFAIVVIISIGGNLIVIWIVLAHKNMRNVTNYFIVNLALSDTLVAALNVSFSFSYMLVAHWPFGFIYCKVSEFIATLTISASVLTLIAIAVDRYIAIMRPFQRRFGKQTILLVTLSIWLLSFIISCPNWIYFRTRTQQISDGGQRTICYSQWPDGKTGKWHEYVYSVSFMILTYFVPIGVMTFTYGRVGLKLWRSQSIGEATKPQLESIAAKKKIVKMMMVVVGIFTVCWLPYHVFFIVTKSTRKVLISSYVQEIYLAVFWLAMSNSMYNPIIYCWLNSKFRNGFKKAFRWMPYVTYKSENSSTSSDDNL